MRKINIPYFSYGSEIPEDEKQRKYQGENEGVQLKRMLKLKRKGLTLVFLPPCSINCRFGQQNTLGKPSSLRESVEMQKDKEGIPQE